MHAAQQLPAGRFALGGLMSQRKIANQKLTPKQDVFCYKLLKFKSASAAYRLVKFLT